MAGAQGLLRMMMSREGDGGLAAAERALELDPRLAEAHAANARVLTADGRLEEAKSEVETALQLDPDSYEVNLAAGRWCYAMRNFRQAASLFEKATTDTETEFYASGMLLSSYLALGDAADPREVARRTLVRCEKAVALEPDNGSAMGFLVVALAILGEHERMKEWMERATLLDPDNWNMRYNFACTLVSVVGDFDAGLDMLAPRLEEASADSLNWMRTDIDMDPVRDHPRFKAMMAAAEARIARIS
jgi:adenylate cyclase